MIVRAVGKTHRQHAESSLRGNPHVENAEYGGKLTFEDEFIAHMLASEAARRFD